MSDLRKGLKFKLLSFPSGTGCSSISSINHYLADSRVFVWGRRPDVSSGTLIAIFESSTFTVRFHSILLLFKENLSELQPCLRNAGKGVSECSILKISLRGMPPDPPKVPCAAKTNFTSATLQSYWKPWDSLVCFVLSAGKQFFRCRVASFSIYRTTKAWCRDQKIYFRFTKS